MPRKIIVDANLLLLWVVGTVDTKMVSMHRRLSAYDIQSYKQLDDILSKFTQIVVTPHILAELWNLLGENKKGNDARHSRLLISARRLIEMSVEIFDPAVVLMSRTEINWLGLSDVSQLTAAESLQCDLVSADGLLCRRASELGIKTHHFWQLTEQ